MTFIAPKVISPFYRNVKRLSRKRKKVLSKNSAWRYNFLTIEQKMWYQLNIENPRYVTFLINRLCEEDTTPK